MMRITLLSDSHNKHHEITNDLPGGDLLIHAGDFMNSGYNQYEAEDFFKWFDKINNYDTKVLIAGNHDRLMQDRSDEAQDILTGYKTIEYLQDEDLVIYYDGHNGDRPEDNIRIYGSPWQPYFHNWAFNLPKNGEELQAKWEAIPSNTDILVTHGPAQTYLDTAGAPYNTPLLGCELLKERIELIKPKIHVCGHIHGGRGYHFNGHTHFFNASLLNEQYNYTNKPFTFDWNKDTNIIEFL
jgi:Icc-related predicted phosphoesterase